MIALAILILITGAVGVNAVYVRHVTESLLAGLDALPIIPVSENTPADVRAVRENFERHLPLLRVTVAYSVLDRVTESLVLLESQAFVGDPSDYASTLTVLRELTLEIARLEKLSMANIL